MDIEDYYFEKSEIPYTVQRTREECLSLMLADMELYGSFVLTAVTGDFGDIIPRFYELGVYLSAPLELRMERIKNRSFEQHGARVLEGGDMYEQEQSFFDMAASRSAARTEQWAQTLACSVMRVDGTADWRVNAAAIAEQYSPKGNPCSPTTPKS